ncbi:hypothetical protein HAX54_044590 [Datura stramonium]|uniref:Uncharacterized protein n=1 Tax=Datura stramonium TaxID=4076 RepID=A0ABS8WIR5_DATST|nr:hypothetical protein [Datura stramonium]
MAKGKGKGSGRPRKMLQTIISFGSSVGVRIQGDIARDATITNTPVPMEQCQSSSEKRSTQCSTTIKKLMMEPTPSPPVEVNAPASAGRHLWSNPSSGCYPGETAKVQEGKEQNMGNSSIEEEPNQTETWANLFAGNRKAENGMTLTYIPPQVVDGNMISKKQKTYKQVWKPKNSEAIPQVESNEHHQSRDSRDLYPNKEPILDTGHPEFNLTNFSALETPTRNSFEALRKSGKEHDLPVPPDKNGGPNQL